MKSTKALFLFLALILPVCIFLFLKFFGRNEFEVKPLFLDSIPSGISDCPVATAPYFVPDSITSQLPFENDSIVMVAFKEQSNNNSSNQFRRMDAEITGLPVGFLTLSGSERHLFWKKCIFFLKDAQDIVLVDRRGRIRGQYISADREDVDRMLTEVTIILKRY